MVVFERARGDGFVVSSSARYEMIQAVSSGGSLFKDIFELEAASCNSSLSGIRISVRRKVPNGITNDCDHTSRSS